MNLDFSALFYLFKKKKTFDVFDLFSVVLLRVLEDFIFYFSFTFTLPFLMFYSLSFYICFLPLPLLFYTLTFFTFTSFTFDLYLLPFTFYILPLTFF